MKVRQDGRKRSLFQTRRDLDSSSLAQFYMFAFGQLLLPLFFHLCKTEIELDELQDFWGFPGGSVVKNLPANEGGAGLICWSKIKLWVQKIPWRRQWQPTPVYFPRNSVDRRAWLAKVHGISKVSNMNQQLNNQSARFVSTLRFCEGRKIFY